MFTRAALGCTLIGKRPKKLTAHLKCNDRSRITLRGTLDTGTQTIAGRLIQVRRGRRTVGTFTLTRAAT